MGISYFRSNAGREGQWREKFSQQLHKLHDTPTDLGNWGPKQPEASVFGTAETIPASVRNSNLPAPIVVATSGGGIQVQWRGTESEFSVFIYSDGSLEYVLRHSGKTETGFLNRIDQINEIVDRNFL